eukprot:TRINITY_DN13792_c0_g4_i1.p2 TRINITY_DN13792_c0_g4~~TRINITY_DN13792_c0_g4_i1.p2  ORF type:complete len:112 (+),score=31.07 TRINITY_DN13792_c0_g4_i1:1741-2076(+)
MKKEKIPPCGTNPLGVNSKEITSKGGTHFVASSKRISLFLGNLKIQVQKESSREERLGDQASQEGRKEKKERRENQETWDAHVGSTSLAHPCGAHLCRKTVNRLSFEEIQN